MVPLQSRELSNDDGSENVAKKMNLGPFKLWGVHGTLRPCQSVRCKQFLLELNP